MQERPFVSFVQSYVKNSIEKLVEYDFANRCSQLLTDRLAFYILLCNYNRSSSTTGSESLAKEILQSCLLNFRTDLNRYKPSEQQDIAVMLMCIRNRHRYLDNDIFLILNNAMKLNTIIYSTHQTIDVNSAVKSAWYLYYRISYYRNIDKKHLWADIYLLCDLLEKMATQDCRSYHTLNSIIKLLSRLNTLSYFSVMLASQVEKRIKSLKVLIEEDKYFLNKTRHFDPWLTAESLAIAYLTFKNTDYQRFLDQVLKKNRQDFDADYVQNCPPSNWQLSYWIYLYKLTPRDQKGLHLESKRADFLRDSIKKNIVYKSTYTTCGPELICNQIYFLLSLVLTMRENKNEATTSIVDYLGLHYYVY